MYSIEFNSLLFYSGAVRINPWNTEKVADSIDRALRMSKDEQVSYSTYIHINTYIYI
jgi:trehalose-6-phosphate synthase